MTLSPQQAHAYQLYSAGQMTHKEIAESVGVSVRTVYSWVRTFSWRRLKDASLHIPTLIAEKISGQVLALLNNINAREDGRRYATLQEAEIMTRLVNCFDKFRRYPTLAQSMQSARGLLDFVDQKDPFLGAQLHKEYNAYFDQQAREGFRPNEMEFGVDPLAFVPSRDVLDEEQFLNEDEEPIELTYDLPCTVLKNAAKEARNQPKENHKTIVGTASQPIALPLHTTADIGNKPADTAGKDEALKQKMKPGDDTSPLTHT